MRQAKIGLVAALTAIAAIFMPPRSAYGDRQLFLPYVTHPVGSWAEAVAIGDVDGDGRNDVVVASSFYVDPENDYHIHVFLQNASGRLAPPVKYPAGNGKSVDIGDLNNDGRNDIVTTAGDSIGVFLQGQSGGLDPMIRYASPHGNRYRVRTGDLNADGLLDVVSIDPASSSHDVEVFLQNGRGSLRSACHL